ncbi:hypothetical protein G9G63_09455 [Paenibacillus sp. EKM202P]|uniref:hypothetical protein n=1 Tax=unclassified Paenibacillus TaxID=185978 RepID=UPI0013ECDFAF|nr:MULTISPECIES: hypothetical protein [unclassified Paenibacillus]KAF6565375.1 hypothetical protein G9G63_09455 [Paenibacillus sp. EKM202P]KAF6569300.1 hypothetical protein G9G64_12640 [Paenibacillus sp. EKM207P]
MNELFTKTGTLKARPPKKYKCRSCGHIDSKTASIKMPGITFAACKACSGSIEERDIHKEWQKRQNGQWDIEREMLEIVKTENCVERSVLLNRFDKHKKWLVEASLGDLVWNHILEVRKEDRQYYYSLNNKDYLLN